MIQTVNMKMGERLKKLRKTKNITQEEAARDLEIARGTIAKYEVNEIQPSPDMIVKLAHYFDCTTDYLLGKDRV